VEQRREESDFIPANNCVVGKKSSLHFSRIHENQSLHYKKNSLTKPFEIYLTPKIREGGCNWIICSLFTGPCDPCRGCKSYLNRNKLEPSVKWTNLTMLSRPLLQTWTTPLSAHVLFMLHYLYLGLAVFTLISFHLSITKRTMWIDPIAQWQHFWNLNIRALPKWLIIVKCDRI
jgi:hypothetical protein